MQELRERLGLDDRAGLRKAERLPPEMLTACSALASIATMSPPTVLFVMLRMPRDDVDAVNIGPPRPSG